MVGQVLIACIPLADTQSVVAHVAVPANKIHHVGKVITVSAPVTGFPLVPVPGTLHDLRIAIGRRLTSPWDKPKKMILGGFRVVPKARFLMNDGQLHVDGNAPFLIARLGVAIPIAFVVEDGAGVRDIAWGNCGAGGEPQGS